VPDVAPWAAADDETRLGPLAFDSDFDVATLQIASWMASKIWFLFSLDSHEVGDSIEGLLIASAISISIWCSG
jgi:hypothetical protein